MNQSALVAPPHDQLARFNKPPRRFPAGFLWGTATSSHQVEGQNIHNQWWDWEQLPGRIWRGDKSGDACGWWRDAEGDLDRAVILGQNAHRMSIEWSRIEPQAGVFDHTAMVRYRQLLQSMRQRGLTPMVTLHHFTNPRWLEERGGWLHPETPRRFARYVAYAVAALGDLCELWCTINEPTIYTGLSFIDGRWPPGRRSRRDAMRVFVAMLRGHAAAAAVIHQIDPRHQVGIVHHFHIWEPDTPRARDVASAAVFDHTLNRVMLYAIRTGRVLPPLGVGLRAIPSLQGSCDFFGLNYYSRSRVAFDIRAPGMLFCHVYTPSHVEQSDFGYEGKTYGEIYPDGLYRALLRTARLGVPIYVTETGLPDGDDDQRPHFLLSHLGAIHRALQAGVDVRGVFIWSLVDNFEWAEGWGLRFGLYEMDERSGVRRLRPSGALYAALARANALPALPDQLTP